MSDENPFQLKPIDAVKNDIHSINRKLNEMKIDVICIKSEINEIKELIKERKEYEQKTNIKSGWWIY